MIEYFYLTFFYGIVFKIYDDIIDNKIKVDEFYLKLLKYFVISLFSILFYIDIIFSTLWFIMAFSSYLMDIFYTKFLKNSVDNENQKDFCCMNETIWIYSCILSVFFIIYHLLINQDKIKNFQIYDIKNITFFIFIFINLFIVIVDIYFFPEHSSNSKLIARFIVLIIISTLIYFMFQYKIYFYDGTIGIMIMNVGFLTASIIYLLYNKFYTKTYPLISEKEKGFNL